MRSKICAVVIVVISVMLFLQIHILNDQLDLSNQQLHLAQEQTSKIQAQIKKYDQNNESVYIDDLYDFIARGIISLEETPLEIEAYNVIVNGSERTGHLYHITNVPKFLTKDGTNINVQATRGETIYLITSQGKNGKQISYYRCYTNGKDCLSDIIPLPINLNDD